MSKATENGISLATPPAIHVGPIVNPGTNETISIVIPLSAQLTTVTSQKIEKPWRDCQKDTRQLSANDNKTHLRHDKTKGCPFLGCIRYGRAFSRAHDLKRHIARHEMRKEKLPDHESCITAITKQQSNSEIVARVMNYRSTVQINRQGTEDSSKSFSCSYCKKKYASENNLRAHVNTHDKVTKTDKNTYTICDIHSKNTEELEEHMKQHVILKNSEESSQKGQIDNDNDFLLEEMLLLRKNPRNTSTTVSSQSDKINTNNGTGRKIRCDYCSKTFKTKWTLSSHVAAHEGRFQFDCSQCGKKFVRKSHYEGHVRSHEATRPYVCEQCGKTFKELKHRREHTKRKHPNNQSAIQTLLDSIGSCSSEELPADQTKVTLLMPVNFLTDFEKEEVIQFD